MFSSCHERGTKKKFRVPIRNRTSDLRIPRSDALPLSHRDSTVSEVYYEVHMTRVLHTAKISNVRHGLMLLWFTDLTEEVTIHRPNVSTLLPSAFISNVDSVMFLDRGRVVRNSNNIKNLGLFVFPEINYSNWVYHLIYVYTLSSN